MSQLSVFSTAQVRQVDRPRYWRDAIRTNFGNLECQAVDQANFTGRIDAVEFWGMRMRHVVAKEHRVTCGASHSAASEFVKVLLQLEGSCHHIGCDSKTLLLPGEWMVYDVLENEQHAIENHGDVHQLVFLLPRSQMRLTEFRRMRTGIIRFHSMDPVSSLLFREIAGHTFKSAPDERKAMESIRLVSRLVPMALYDAAGQSNEEQTSPDALSARVKRYIDAHLLDSFLTISDIAEAFQCSKRALHIAFEREGSTLSEYLWERRLDRIRDDLSNPNMRRDSITEIAFSWGFTSSAHFSRKFAIAFGQSPSSYRRSVLEAVLPATGMAASSGVQSH